MCKGSNLILMTISRGELEFHRCRNGLRPEEVFLWLHASVIQSELWPISSGSHFILFLLLKAHPQRTLLMPLALTCKALHNLISANMATFLSYSPASFWVERLDSTRELHFLLIKWQPFLPWTFTLTSFAWKALWAPGYLGAIGSTIWLLYLFPWVLSLSVMTLYTSLFKILALSHWLSHCDAEALSYSPINPSIWVWHLLDILFVTSLWILLIQVTWKFDDGIS